MRRPPPAPVPEYLTITLSPEASRALRELAELARTDPATAIGQMILVAHRHVVLGLTEPEPALPAYRPPDQQEH